MKTYKKTEKLWFLFIRTASNRIRLNINQQVLIGIIFELSAYEFNLYAIKY